MTLVKEHPVNMSHLPLSHFKTDVNQVTVKAFSKEHARRFSSGIAGFPIDRIISVDETKKPRAAKTCKVDDFPSKGTRKWKMVYEVYAYGYKVALGADKYHYENMELVKGNIELKGDAVQVAREMSIKHQLPMTVQVAQVLSTHEPTTSDIEPRSTMGEYVVKYFA